MEARESKTSRHRPLDIPIEVEEPSATEPDHLADSSRRRVLKCARRGLFSKAARALSEVHHDLPDDLPGKLLALHPRQPPPAFPDCPPFLGDDFTPKEVASCLATFPRGSAAGVSGLTADLLQGPDGPERSRLLQELARFCSDFAWSRFPGPIATFLAGARLIALGKPGGGVRPIAVGETLRRLVGKMLIRRYQQPVVDEVLLPLQVGVGLPGGAEQVIHKVRHWLLYAPPGEGLLQLDFSNAFNCFDRGTLLQAVAISCPAFLPYATACYGQPAALYHSSGVLSSEAGVHQGDPLGPLFFALVAQPLAAFCSQAGISWSHWYLDDGYLVGPLSALHSLLPLLRDKAALVGLRLNVAKCQLLSPGPVPEEILPDVPRTPAGGALRVLGAPIGALAASVDWVMSNTYLPWKRALDRLSALGEAHLSTLILRHCLTG